MRNEQSKVVTVREGAITVEKSFEPDQFPVPAIAFVVRSERDAAETVRVVDELPEGVAPEDVGFHPDYGEEHWDVREESIVFEREFDPDEEFTTVYGLRDNDLGDVERFLAEPTVEGDGSEDVPGNDGGQIVRDVLSGTAESIPGLDGDSEDEEIDPIVLDDPSADGLTDDGGIPSANEAAAPSDPGPVGSSDAEPSEASSARPVEDGSVAAALVRELRAGAVDESVERALREELGTGPGAASGAEAGAGSTDARIRQLQAEVSDLQAYADALEAFLDENGDAQQLLSSVRSEVDELAGQLDGIGERVSAVDDRVTALDERVEGIDDTLGDEIGALDDRVEDVSGDLDDAASRIDDLRSDAADAEELAATTERVDALDETFDDLTERVDALGDLEGRVEEIDALDEELDAVAGDLRDRLDEIEADIVEIEAFRERMASVFAGGEIDEADGRDSDSDADGNGDGDGES